MKTIVLTGQGDIAKKIADNLDKKKYKIYNPSKIELDVTEYDSVVNYFSTIDNVDVVVNLAGTLYSSSIIESDVKSWIKDIEVNLIGTYLVCRENIIKNTKVNIINISSTAAYNSYFDWSSYCASKSGVIKISNALYLDGYKVVTLCPGAIETKLRNGLNINNPNVMSIEEGVEPIIKAIEGGYSNGDIVLYRKNEFKVFREV